MLRRTLTSAAVGGLCLLPAGCGSDTLGPEPAAPSIVGSWAYVATGLQGTIFDQPITCDYELQMQLSGASTFSGIYRDSRLVCVVFGQTELVGLGDGRIVAGAFDGSNVAFDMDAESIHNSGRLSGDRMEGDVEIVLVVQHESDIDTTLVTGRWYADR